MSNVTRPTEAQLKFAVKIADSTGIDIPGEIYSDKFKLSKWIDENIAKTDVDENGKHIFKPSVKQVNFAEQIASLLKLTIPEKCYQNAAVMSEWINENNEMFVKEAKKRPTEKMVNFAKSIYKHNPDAGDPSFAFESSEKLSEWITNNKPDFMKNESNGSGGK